MTFTFTWNDLADLVMAIWIGCVLAVIAWYVIGDKPPYMEEDDEG